MAFGYHSDFGDTSMKKIIFLTLIIVLFVLFYILKKPVISYMLQTNLEECHIETLTKLPSEFSVVIGHAYGSPQSSTMNSFISPIVEDFIKKEKIHIESVIFTGDVFSVPSSIKWKKLFQKFENLNIFVAPGNHDIIRPDSREVFQSNNFIRQDYPFKIEVSGQAVLISDSISNSWRVSDDLKELIEAQSSDLLVARHNIIVSDLLHFANSQAGGSALPTVQKFATDLNTDNDITWIMGDGGAFRDLPRLTCHKFRNHRFIINGIGDVPGDSVLIISAGVLYQYPLN